MLYGKVTKFAQYTVELNVLLIQASRARIPMVYTMLCIIMLCKSLD